MKKDLDMLKGIDTEIYLRKIIIRSLQIRKEWIDKYIEYESEEIRRFYVFSLAIARGTRPSDIVRMIRDHGTKDCAQSINEARINCYI